METEQADLRSIKNILEAALLASEEPLGLGELVKLFGNEIGSDLLRRLLDDLKAEWSGRGTELVAIAGGWRFQTKVDVQKYLDRLSHEKPPKYSRAVLETLAIIAYRQPVTRGDIEEIRGVSVSPGILKALEGRGWIDAVGHREVPGRPALYATTRGFLNDLSLRSLQELPPIDDLGTLVSQTQLLEASTETSGENGNRVAEEADQHTVDADSIPALTRL